MWLKIIIVVVVLVMLYSLASGFYYLMKDRTGSTRLVWSLTARITLAAIIIGLIVYGASTGQLNISAPWIGK